MTKYFSILTLSVFLLGGCAGFDLLNMQSGVQDTLKENIHSANCLKECRVTVVEEAAEDKSLSALAGTPDSDLLTKLSAINRFFIVSGKKEPPQTILSRGEIEDFIRAVSKTLFNPWFYVYPEKFAKERKTLGGNMPLLKIFQKYYEAYLDGKFIDRFGNQIGKPKFGANINNDTVTGAITVFFEAVLDYQLRTPLLYTMKDEEKKYAFCEKGTPTCAGLDQEEDGFSLRKIMLKSNQECSSCGVTEGESRAIRYLSSLAGEVSAILGGLVVESFGGFEVSLVVGGYFSVGDNQTLAVAAKKIIEIYSRRLTERLAFDYFCSYGYEVPPKGQKGGKMVEKPRDDKNRLHHGRTTGFINRFK